MLFISQRRKHKLREVTCPKWHSYYIAEEEPKQAVWFRTQVLLSLFENRLASRFTEFWSWGTPDKQTGGCQCCGLQRVIHSTHDYRQSNPCAISFLVTEQLSFPKRFQMQPIKFCKPVTFKDRGHKVSDEHTKRKPCLKNLGHCKQKDVNSEQFSCFTFCHHN